MPGRRSRDLREPAGDESEQQGRAGEGPVEPPAEVRDEPDVGAERPDRRVERRGGRGRDRPERAGGEREPQQGRDRGEREQVGRQAGDERGAPEEDERHGRGGDGARGRDRERAAEAQRDRRALEPHAYRRGETVDRRHGDERELESRPDHGPRVECEHARGRECEQMPGVAVGAGEPGQRDEHAGCGGAHDRGAAAHDRRVGHDRRDRAAVSERARHAGDPGEAEDGGDEQHDVAARDGEQVGQAGCAEILDGRFGKCGGAAESHARRDPRCLVVTAREQRRMRTGSQPVEHAREPAAAADHREPASSERLVHPLARQPRAPVEPVHGRRHRREGAADLDDRALAQLAASAQLERVAVELRDGRAPERPGTGLPVDHEPNAGDVAVPRSERIGGTLGDAMCRP